MKSSSATRVIVDLNAYANNLRIVRQMIPTECAIMAVVKANAYGHGAIRIARKALTEGVSMLGVATVDEGLSLRDAGIEAPIVVMVQPPEEAIGPAVEHELRLMISDIATAEHVGEHARRLNKVVPVHCKIDSGMGRQGFDIETALNDIAFLTRVSHIDIEGISTHFPIAETVRDQFTATQLRQFKHLLKQLEKQGIPFEMAHAANSAAIINYPNSVLDMVRPGLMTYGVWPTETPPVLSPLHPVLRWETRVIMLKEPRPGTTIGYGRTYTVQEPMKIALLPVGYADGYKYKLANNADVIIRGIRCPVRGAISMDQITVDVTSVPGVAVGDTATLVGTDGSQSISVDELAQRAQTIPYDILTGIGPRCERVYVE
jgi:alanine racemase